MKLLVVGLGLLVIVLGWIQWRWSDEIRWYEYARRERLLGFSTWRFKTLFDGEIARLSSAFEDVGGVEQSLADGLSERRRSWAEGTLWPGLLKDIYHLPTMELTEGAAVQIRHLQEDGRFTAFESLSSDWRTPLADSLREVEERTWRPSQSRVAAAIPAVLLRLPSAQNGWVVLELDRKFMANEFLPHLQRWTFPAPTFSELSLLVLESESRRVLYSTEGLASEEDFGYADLTYGLVARQSDAEGPFEGVRKDARLTPPSLVDPTAAEVAWWTEFWAREYFSGHWRVLVRKREMPIAKGVAGARTRDVVAAFGVLALLVASLVTLVIVTRRMQLFARRRLDLVARISHELRTPITVLAAAGDNLADAIIRDEERIRDYGRWIQKETQRLRESVENALFLARRGVGTQPPAKLEIDLVALVEESLRWSAQSIARAGFDIERQLPDSAVPILADPPGVRSAVLNLISNGLKYGRPGGWLRLSIEQDREIRLIVSDGGAGIEAAELAEIWEPYVRGQRAEEEQIEGSGLGLAVVRDVMIEHNGRVSVKSQIGTGTQFILHFPLQGLP